MSTEMTYEDFRKVVETLNIQYIQVTLNLESEFSKFKDLDLIEDSDIVFEYIDQCKENCDTNGWYVIFWLNPSQYKLESYLVLESGDDLIRNILIDPKTEKPKNQIALDYDAFIKLIS